MKALITLCIALFICFNAKASQPIAPELLFTPPAVYSMKINPNGRYLVSFEHQDTQNVFTIIDSVTLEEHVALSIAHKEKLKVEEYQWIDNKTLYVELDKQSGFLHIDDTQEEIDVSWQKFKLEGHLVAALPSEENTVIFAHRENKNNLKLYKATTEQLEQQDLSQAIELKKELKNALAYFYDESNSVLLTVRLDDEKLEFWFLKSDQKIWKRFYTIDKDNDFIPVGLLDENTMAVLTSKDLDTRSLVKFDINSETFGEVIYQHPTYDLYDAVLNPIGSGVKYVRYIDHGVPKVQYFSADEDALTKNLMARVNNENIVTVDASVDNRKKLMASFSAKNPGKYYYYDKATDELKLIKSVHPQLDNITLSDIEPFSVKVNEHTVIEGMLSRPVGYNNNTLLVYPHGGPVGIRDNATYNGEIQYFTSRGYSVLNVNFRGSSGYGKSFLDKGRAQFGKLIEQDITAVVNAVQQKYNYQNMCSMGTGYGGYSAVMLAIYHPEQYQCVVSMYGIYDLPLLFNASNYKTLEDHRDYIAQVVGEFDESLKTVSPFYFAQKLNAPTLLIAGKKDEVADFEQANRMKFRLNQLQKNVDYLFFDNVGHGQHNWYGDRLQFSYVDHFIRTQLNLEPEITEHYSKILAKEYVRIADAYTFSDNVDNDDKKAYEFYQLASQYGESRATFNVGSFYHQGKYVEQNINSAIEWYKKSSDAGYDDASFRLGDLYYSGKETEQDYEASFHYFNKAHEQQHEDAEFSIARAHCLGRGVEKSFENCLNRLFYVDNDDKTVSSLSEDQYKTWRNVVTDVIWENTFSASEKQQFEQNLFADTGIKVKNIDVADIDYGLFKRDTRSWLRSRKVHEKTTTKIALEKGRIFGVYLSFNNKDTNVDAEKVKTLIKLRWRLPDAIKNKETQKTKIINTSKEYGYYWTLVNDEDLVPGDYTLEIFTLDDKPLLSKTFTVAAEAKT
ncbi:prolyl oligopeptidase family serine peptidase [Thalassotalea ponticola]|uniref:prolyl oligopeptidase family serine peptidase n=1 Tax=Thalassotalea ponticola TaxID=1523392 RepID=UPI0025B2DAFE|nr:prolyl oligopeptidase family serine peptidase [Thalassotalea ponticola]MDN3651314.1 prolyl oligopeptidase family serine peptidase [Thalassotalea ponticola]